MGNNTWVGSISLLIHYNTYKDQGSYKKVFSWTFDLYSRAVAAFYYLLLSYLRTLSYD